MKPKKPLSEMTLDELYTEKRIAEDTFPSAKNSQSILLSFFIVSLTIALAMYAMKDTFSYILSGIIVWMVYAFIKKFLYTNRIVKEIKSRG